MSQLLQRWILLSLLVTSACQGTSPLPDDATEALHRAADPSGERGTLIYEGTVGRRDSDAPPLFRYERWVLDVEEGLQSTHLAYSNAGDPVVLHQAEHDSDYQLLGFREIHAQTGLVGQVDIASDGTATFTTTVDGRTRTRTEAPGDPLHVGPTLFGYVLTNWDSLVAGTVHTLRFVVLSKRQSYRFKLKAVDDQPSTFEMKATSSFVGLAVPSMTLVFDQDRDIVSYSGRVPPLEELGDRLKTLDATVTYEHSDAPYR